MLERILTVFRPKPKEITPEQRQFQLDEVFNKEHFTNQVIWFAVLATGSLSEEQIQTILDSYKEYKSVYPDDNPPVTMHLQRAGIKSSRFFEKVLQRVAFNYDEGLDARERFDQDRQESTNGKDKNCFPIDYSNSKYRSVEERTYRDLGWMRDLHMIRVSERFNVQTQARETIYAITDNEYDAGVYVFSKRLMRYEKEVFPLLESGQMIKPSSRISSPSDSEPADIVQEQTIISSKKKLEN